ncbi:MAG: pyrroline-5-carboxylate reductase [Coxiellaceae bacterium]|nr:pyrroline-5-carboxylate reductase [Coxiellaceae bacterium]
MQKTIAFIGAGNMSRAFIVGLLQSGFDPKNIWASSPTIAKHNELNALSIHTTTNNAEAAAHADIIIFAIKPWVIEAVCVELKAIIQDKNPLLISLATGIKTATISALLDNYPVHLVRTMPNIASAVGAGATGLFANTAVTHAQKIEVEKLFRATGVAVWVEEENLLDVITAVSGSGPAYLFYFFEAMQRVGESMGLTAEQAKILVSQTAVGAAKMAMERPESFEDLRRLVTAEKGTTAAAMAVFDQNELKSTVKKAMQACLARAKELAK